MRHDKVASIVTALGDIGADQAWSYVQTATRSITPLSVSAGSGIRAWPVAPGGTRMGAEVT